MSYFRLLIIESIDVLMSAERIILASLFIKTCNMLEEVTRQTISKVRPNMATIIKVWHDKLDSASFIKNEMENNI